MEKIEELTQENTALKTGLPGTSSGQVDVEKIKQVKQAYEEILAGKEREHQKLLEDVDALLADSEASLAKVKQERDQLRVQCEGLSAKAEQVA